MSRGLGRIEMGIIDLLYRYRDEGIEVSTIAGIVYKAPDGILAYEWDAGAPKVESFLPLRSLQPKNLYVRPTFTYRLTDSYFEAIQRRVHPK